MLIIFISFIIQMAISSSETFFTEPICTNNNQNSTINCTQSDKNFNRFNKNNPKNKIIDLIKNQETKELWIAIFDLNEPEILQTLCQKLKESDFKLKIVTNFSLNVALLNELSFCTKKTAISEFSFRTLKPNKFFNFMHMKFLIFNPNQNPLNSKLLFSSGNLTSATYFKHENWNLIQGSELMNSSLEKHKCIFLNLFNNFKTNKDYVANISSCLETKEDKNLKSFFIPGEGDLLLNEIEKLVLNSNHIRIASHRFTLKPLKKILINFLKRGGKLEFYLDREYLEPILEQNNYRFKELLNILELYSLGAQIIPIHNDYKNGVYFHHKLMLFDQARSNNEWAALLGSGNLTTSSILDRTNKQKHLRKSNFENMYISKNSNFIKKYLEYLKKFEKPIINLIFN